MLRGPAAIAAATVVASLDPGDTRFEPALIELSEKRRVGAPSRSRKRAGANRIDRRGCAAPRAHQVLFSNDASDAAQNAIAMIQARAGSEKGAVSLSDGGGELSLAAGESGAVSIADEE